MNNSNRSGNKEKWLELNYMKVSERKGVLVWKRPTSVKWNVLCICLSAWMTSTKCPTSWFMWIMIITVRWRYFPHRLQAAQLRMLLPPGQVHFLPGPEFQVFSWQFPLTRLSAPNLFPGWLAGGEAGGADGPCPPGSPPAPSEYFFAGGHAGGEAGGAGGGEGRTEASNPGWISWNFTVRILCETLHGLKEYNTITHCINQVVKLGGV